MELSRSQLFALEYISKYAENENVRLKQQLIIYLTCVILQMKYLKKLSLT